MTAWAVSDSLNFRSMQLQATAIVRDRFQLTIPGLVRGGADWVSPGSVVTIVQQKPGEIVIRPHVANKKTNWERLWRSIDLARSHKGRYKGSLSEFVAKDRESH